MTEVRNNGRFAKKYTIKHFQELAQKNNGKCLSGLYKSITEKINWICKEGHEFSTTPRAVITGHWCPHCSKNAKLTIEIMQKHAEDKGGKCLSKVYKNAHTKLEWECKKGHKWFSVPVNIRNNNAWCPRCVGRNLTIQDMHDLAKKRRGKCLSEEFVNSSSKLKWECLEGHKFSMDSDHVTQGQWCPKCHFFYNEELCRTTLEQLFNKKFEKLRPNWLKNKLGNQLELDGFCKEAKLAFEYHGEQHFNLTYYSPSKKHLEKNIDNDQQKIELCINKNIDLLVFSYKDDLTNLPRIIQKQLKKIGRKCDHIDFNKNIDFNKVYAHKTKISKMKEVARKLGGKCLSTKFISQKYKLKWQCKLGHIWEATPGNIIGRGAWCGECRKDTLDIFQKIALSKGGKCLSEKYVNSRNDLEYECKRSHKFKASPRNTKNGTWCQKCARIERRGKSLPYKNK